MVTHFLSEKDVNAYMADLRARILKMNPQPEVFCALTGSGTALLPILAGAGGEFDHLQGVGIGVVKDGENTIINILEEDIPLIKDKRVLLIDSSIHSGSTMAACHQRLCELGASAVCSYSLVIKRSTSFVPTFFGLMIEDPDRAYFLLEEIPNNRLEAGKAKTSYVHLEQLKECDIERDPVAADVASMDRITWGDRFYDIQTSHNRQTYLLKELNTAVGYVTVHVERKDFLSIEEVAVDTRHKKKGYGGILMRFADTMARHSGCQSIRLNAIEGQIPFYENFGYSKLPKKPIKLGADEIYHPMTRPILYHIQPTEA